MDKFPVCTHCGFTWDEYRARGLLGCPQCYAAFGDALQADLLWFHRALEHVPGGLAPAGARPEAAPRAAEPISDRAALRERLAEALRREDYAEAARLRKRLDGMG